MEKLVHFIQFVGIPKFLNLVKIARKHSTFVTIFGHLCHASPPPLLESGYPVNLVTEQFKVKWQ